MTAGQAWATIGLLLLTTVTIKAVGPIATGGRTLGPRALAVIALTPAALLGALVATQALSRDGDYRVGADTIGVAVAGIALWRGLGVLPVVVIAAGVTAALRAVT
jgi:uncharacterized membrane protein